MINFSEENRDELIDLIQLEPNKEDELIQYYVVNSDLKMSPGKIAAQVAHASMLIALQDQNKEEFQQWKNLIMKKIILKGSEKDLFKLKEKGFVAIIDKGLTEIKPDSLTAIGLPIMKRSQLPND